MSNIPEQTVQYVEAASEALCLATKLANTVAKDREAALAKVASVVSVLVAEGLIDRSEEKRAHAQLANHADALDILDNVVHVLRKQAKEASARVSAELGAPASAKEVQSSGPVRDKTANFDGYRRGENDPPSASDLALFSGLGIPLQR
mgnify:CR=1 FL=1